MIIFSYLVLVVCIFIVGYYGYVAGKAESQKEIESLKARIAELESQR